MARISPQKCAALDVLDRLLFNQTLFLSLNEEWKQGQGEKNRDPALIVLLTLVKRVNEEVAGTGSTGVEAEVLKHLVLCLLEVNLSDEPLRAMRDGRLAPFELTDLKGRPLLDPAKDIDSNDAARLHKHDQSFFSDIISVMGEQAHGISRGIAIEIAMKLRTEFHDAPNIIRYRLVDRALSAEFLNAPVKFFCWMYEIRALKSNKFVALRVKASIPDELKVRIGLLCEFNLLREMVGRCFFNQGKVRRDSINRLQDGIGKRLSEAVNLQMDGENYFYATLDHQKSFPFSSVVFDLYRMDDSAYLHQFLEKVAKRQRRSRFWTGVQSSWCGVIGAGMIRTYLTLVDSEKKITRNSNNYSKSSADAAQEETVAERVCKVLGRHGLTHTPGSLYETFLNCYQKEPAGLFSRARQYHRLLQQFEIAIPAYVHDVAYLGLIVTTSPELMTE